MALGPTPCRAGRPLPVALAGRARAERSRARTLAVSRGRSVPSRLGIWGRSVGIVREDGPGFEGIFVHAGRVIE
jgi:hypothetical protein